MKSTLNLRLLTAEDWKVLRGARLTALLDSPHAFTSSYLHESAWGESEWRRALDHATWIVAFEHEHPIGLAKSIGEFRRPSERHVESIWVAPRYRRRGVCRALLHALAESERRMGVTDLLLWVLEDNYVAKRVYATLGFEPTGERQPMSPFGQFELRLRLSVGQLRDASGTRSDHFLVDDPRAELGPSPDLRLQERYQHADVNHTLPHARELSASRRSHPSSH